MANSGSRGTDEDGDYLAVCRPTNFQKYSMQRKGPCSMAVTMMWERAPTLGDNAKDTTTVACHHQSLKSLGRVHLWLDNAEAAPRGSGSAAESGSSLGTPQHTCEEP